MVLTITVVDGNGQTAVANGTDQEGNPVLSPNDIAQLMSGQTVTGLLNPDGSITLNSNIISAQQLGSATTSANANQISSTPSLQHLQQNGLSSPNPLIATTSQYCRNIKFEPQSHNIMATSAVSGLSNTQAAITTSDLSNTSNNINNGSNNNNNSNINNNNCALQTISNSSHSQQQRQVPTPKKTGQKRMTAKQKQQAQQQIQRQQQQLQQQQQQQQQQQLELMQNPDTRQQQIMTPTSDPTGMRQQSAQVVATVQLPNGQIGQLIAPSGGLWSPSALNLQQLSMAVAAATGTMPQTLSLPLGSSTGIGNNGPAQQLQNSNMPPNSMQNQQQQSAPQQTLVSTSECNSNDSNRINSNSNFSSTTTNNSHQQVMTTVQLPNNQLAQVIGRQHQMNQIWSGGPISFSHLTALAQQGVIQIAPLSQEDVSSSSLSQSFMNSSTFTQTLPTSISDQISTQDLNGVTGSRWQSVNSMPGQQRTIQSISPSISAGTQQRSVSTENNSSSATTNSTNTTTTANHTSKNHSGPVTMQQSTTGSAGDNKSQASWNQSQRKLKRLACTCPNCRDGDNNRISNDKKKQHICHFQDCNKVYGKTSHLRAHLRWHSGERPYICSWSFCGKKFTRSDELQRHKRTHTGEKRFQCQECLKRFMRSDHLAKHLKTHLSTKKCNGGGGNNNAQAIQNSIVAQGQQHDSEQLQQPTTTILVDPPVTESAYKLENSLLGGP